MNILDKDLICDIIAHEGKDKRRSSYFFCQECALAGIAVKTKREGGETNK